MTIDRFTKDEFEEVLEDFKEGWLSRFMYEEWRYHHFFGENAIIFVNSSVGRDEKAKMSGKDSIRVWVEYQGKPIKKSQRWITRVAGWRDRLRDKLSESCKIINDMDNSPKCPQCGGKMVLRAGVHGQFYGCLKFPNCRGTRDYEEKLPDQLNWLKG